MTCDGKTVDIMQRKNRGIEKSLFSHKIKYISTIPAYLLNRIGQTRNNFWRKIGTCSFVESWSLFMSPESWVRNLKGRSTWE